ncbi:uncharacterized protein BJ171DRAFT_249708 [Polychytrium aggregatum]|uniref:uncharacterized protein n=1 Tax=Polychytrium aggregatum TaxID=110093 RepID=UPI0022FEFB7C|nr:uncharacterized protein BJ171DRAFT_249708 [Polychytrium aggregatum]KAI9193627.1 hypothetical protein BJ171DRAFT_249708 [Polychytrium aggregatum]
MNSTSAMEGVAATHPLHSAGHGSNADPSQATIWNRALPYDTLHDQGVLLGEIKTGLAVCLEAADHIGIIHWVVQLSHFLDLKYRLSYQDRAVFVQIFTDLIVLPSVDSATLEKYISITCKLLKKDDHIPPGMLVVEWRPLYEVTRSMFFGKRREAVQCGTGKHAAGLIKLMGLVRRYFKPSTTAEVLAEFLPWINIHDFNRSLGALSFMCLLLPTHEAPPPPDGWDPSTTPKFYWVPTLFSLWQLVAHSPAYDIVYMEILARLAVDQIATPWNVGWTAEQVKYVFSCGLKNTEVPVGSSTVASTNVSIGQGGSAAGAAGFKIDVAGGAAELFASYRKSKTEIFAAYIVNTMYPSLSKVDDCPAAPATNSMSQLSKMMQAIESFYHPSNTGRWTFDLACFAQHLASEFLKRVRKEQRPDCKTPQAFCLTTEMKREFVLILRGVLFLSMFGKDRYAVSASHTALKHLAWIEPDLIIPGLLERAYPALENLTETHRTVSCIGALSALALPLISRSHYPQGAKHIASLLHLTIPGIDINDPIKTFSSLMFINHASMCISFIDMTKGAPLDFSDPSMVSDADEQNALCREATAEFEPWLLKFLDRVFSMFENLPQQYAIRTDKQTLETSLIQMLLYSCERVFSQLSDDLHAVALKKIVEFVELNVIPNATCAIGSVCASVSYGGRARALSVLLPLCERKIVSELAEHGASSISTGANASSASSTTQHPFGFATMSDSTLHWYQSIMYSIVQNSGSIVLDYKASLIRVLDTSFELCRSRRGYKWAGRLLRNLLCSLTHIYPLEARNVDQTQWDSPDYSEHAYQSWGEPSDLDNINVTWHVPNNAELDFAVELIDRYLPMAFEKLDAAAHAATELAHMKTNKEQSNETLKWLCILRCILHGMTALVDDYSAENPAPSANEFHEFIEREGHPIDGPPLRRQTVQSGYCFQDKSDPRMAKILRYRSQASVKLLEYLRFHRTHNEDEIELIKIVIKCSRILYTDRGVDKTRYDNLQRGYTYGKAFIKSESDDKKWRPRHMLVKRAYMQHLFRLRHNSCSAQLKRHKIDGVDVLEQTVHEILECCLGKYASVRKIAQSVLTRIVVCFTSFRWTVFPKLLHELESESAAGATGGKAAAAGLAKALLAPATGTDSPFLDPRHLRALAADASGSSSGAESEGESDRMKGALYLLKSATFISLGLKSMSLQAAFMVVMSKAQHQEKPTIQELLRKVYREFVLKYYTLPLRYSPDNKLSRHSEYASYLLRGCSNGAPNVASLVAALELNNTESIQSYNQLIPDLLKILKDPRLHWRFATITTSLIELVLRSDQPISKELAEFALNGVCNELQTLRRASLSTLSNILLILKKRCPRPPRKIQVQVGTEWKADDPDGAFQDNGQIGWYCWPESVEVYPINVGSSDELPFSDPTSSEAQDAIQAALGSPEFWERFIKFHAQEKGGDNETFSNTMAQFYKGLFINFEDRFLDLLKPKIEGLCQSAMKSEQRAGAEILSGLIRGSKHWPTGPGSKTERLWAWVVPVIRSTLAGCTSECLKLWDNFLKFVSSDRDPRRLRPILDCVFGAVFDPTSQSFFTEAKKLFFVRTVLATIHWRALPHVPALMRSYMGHLDNPYKQVRELLGANINEITQIMWRPGTQNVDALLAWNVQHPMDFTSIGLCGFDGQRHAVWAQMDVLVKDAIEQLRRLRAEQAKGDPTAPASVQYVNASKTVLAWLAYGLRSHRPLGLYPYAEDLLTEVLYMQDCPDKDLQEQAAQLTQMFAHLPYPSQRVPEMIKHLTQLLVQPRGDAGSEAVHPVGAVSWHIKVRALPMLQVFYFKHLFLMRPEAVAMVMEAIYELLMDHQVEVRQLASVTLSGLIRCSQRDAIVDIKARFDRLLDIKLPSRQRGAPAPPGFAEAVLRRHSAVLGLSGLVQAFPYEVPKWMPSTLVRLASCITDPNPISVTVKNMFSDFRRTHQDTWHEDKEQFSEDDLYTLSDLFISPSYYA